MFEKLLVPTDFSSATEKVLEYVGGLKKLGVEDVLLVHVSLRDGQEDMVLAERERRISTRMQKEKKIVETMGLKARPLFLRGNPPDEILKLATEENVSMIVSGSHGKGPLDEILMGSTSEKLGRESQTPVLLVRYGILEEKPKEMVQKFATNAFKKVLFPTDFSTCSERALRFIKEVLVGAGLAEVVLTHVVDDRHILTLSRREKLKKEHKETLNKVRNRLRGPFKVSSHLLVGYPVAELLRLAGEKEVNTIVIGSHGKGIVKEAFLGSVSQNLIRMANKPVLVVH
ncbi:MAG TPA: universal stress protein [Candidatus Subteraquimicrobiales bacterium]